MFELRLDLVRSSAVSAGIGDDASLTGWRRTPQKSKRLSLAEVKGVQTIAFTVDFEVAPEVRTGCGINVHAPVLRP